MIGIRNNANQEANVDLLKNMPLIEAVTAIILAPIVEELVFRKFIYGYLSRTKLHIILNIAIVSFQQCLCNFI